MTTEQIQIVVAKTMNILEHEYGVVELDGFGMVTVDEIVERIENENDAS